MWGMSDREIKINQLQLYGELRKPKRRREYWTCPECGANLDPGEKCDCDLEDLLLILDL